MVEINSCECGEPKSAGRKLCNRCRFKRYNATRPINHWEYSRRAAFQRYRSRPEKYLTIEQCMILFGISQITVGYMTIRGILTKDESPNYLTTRTSYNSVIPKPDTLIFWKKWMRMSREDRVDIIDKAVELENYTTAMLELVTKSTPSRCLSKKTKTTP